MKALDILQKTRSQLEDSHEFSKIYDEAILELEALQKYIKSLEAQLTNTEQLTCKDCSKKLLCEMAQKSKDTFGTKLDEQWFICFEKDTQ